MPDTFAQLVEIWAKASQERMLAILRQSADDIAAEMTEMCPVQTGYLRGSQAVTIGEPAPVAPIKGAVAPLQVASLTIFGWDGIESLYIVYTANYARYVEYGARGRPGVLFVARAVQRWPAIVQRNALALLERQSP